MCMVDIDDIDVQIEKQYEPEEEVRQKPAPPEY